MTVLTELLNERISLLNAEIGTLLDALRAVCEGPNAICPVCSPKRVEAITAGLRLLHQDTEPPTPSVREVLEATGREADRDTAELDQMTGRRMYEEDSDIFEKIAEWQNAPSNTASAGDDG